MDALTLSRIQFAVAAAFYFIFVPLTLGLSVLIAFMESRYVSTNEEIYLKMTKFWGKLLCRADSLRRDLRLIIRLLLLGMSVKWSVVAEYKALSKLTAFFKAPLNLSSRKACT